MRKFTLREASHTTVSLCDCAAHRAQPRPQLSAWSSVLPILACAVCPACLSTYAKLFSIAGVSIGLSQEHQTLLLLIAIGASLSVSGWRSWRTHRVWPVLVASVGSACVLSGHLFGEIAFLEWLGVIVLAAGGAIEQLRIRRQRTVNSHIHVSAAAD